MISEKMKKGNAGEEAASDFLAAQGYKVLFRNFRCRFGEVDIIAAKEGFLTFVEVKTRRPGGYGRPCEAVDGKKQKRLIRCAEVFLENCPGLLPLQPRMDIMEVFESGTGFYFNHIKDAFGSGGQR